ncbi:MAG: M23 family peptidase [Balneolaceae bacterium]|nr:M23 family metallopeptidase [Balneolaceae bacterium]TVQ06005.1 MAG: M23 family peptidase [Balneolaceae bacterium]
MFYYINSLISLILTIIAILFGINQFNWIPGLIESFIVSIGLYLLFSGLVSWILSPGKADTASNNVAIDRSNWPLSGPFRRLGKRAGSFLFTIIFSITNFLSFLNPFLLFQIIRQSVANEKLKIREQQSDADPGDYKNKARYCLPFRGEWLVYNGGITPRSSHSWDLLGQRYAYDFVIADQNYSSHSGRGTKLRDYYCYGEEILASAPGTIMEIENRISDAPFVGFGFSDFTARHFAGNYVVIKHAENEFGIYAHLINGSVCVRPGEQVAQGQVIGKCGHSGNSTEPHLHFHLQDSPDFLSGMGLPIRFDRLKINQRETTESFIQGGQFVENISIS